MGTSSRDYWWWADGIYMVMPAMTKLYKATGDRRYLDKQLAAIAEALSRRPHYVYGSREKYFNWDGSLLESPEEQQPVDVHESDTESLQRA
jgi:hypothetical protein